MMTQVCRFMSGPVVYCLVLLGLVASWAFAADPAAKAQELLASSHPNGWLEAVEQLAAAEQVSTLIQLLREDPRKLVRTASALVLPLFQEERVIVALSQALDDQEDWVRLASIEALAFLGGEQVQGSLQRAIKDQDPEVRKAAEEALERLKLDKAIPFSTVERGFHSEIREAISTVFRSEDRWKRFWMRHAASEPHPIDFSKEMAIAVFMGEQQTGGFSLDIQQVEDKSGLLKVLVHITKADQETIIPHVLTQPYHIIKLQKMDVPIRFAKRSSAP
jgi:hypothetical protein